MKIKSEYLQKLGFDENLRKGVIAKYLVNPRLVFLLVIAIVVIGVISLFNLPRRLNPEVQIPFVSITTILPGAGPEEIESLVTIPIEDAVESVDGLISLQSVSRENVSIISMEFASGVDSKEASRDVQALVDKAGDLPDEVIDPQVSDFDFENQPVLVFSLSSESDISSLINFSKRMQDKLEGDPKINSVLISGTEEQEIQVLVSPETVTLYGVSPIALTGQIKSSLSSFPSGVMTTGQSNVPISVEKSIRSINDVRDTMLNLNGQVVRLGDIATITQRSKPSQLTSYIASNINEPQRAVVMAVFKTKGAKIDEVSTIAQEIIQDELSGYNGSFRYDVSEDSSNEIREQFDELSISFTQTLLLVFVTLFIFLGIRQSLIVSLSIPLTFLISITAMNYAGLSLNFLSVFSLLLALGLLVDDAIVMTSAMTTYFRTEKFTANEAGLLVWRDFITPIWSTTITTVWAFVPLLLSTGIIGEFIKTIPIVVSATLIASTTVAVLITLPANMQAFSAKAPRRVKASILLVSLIFIVGLIYLVTPKDSAIVFWVGFVSCILFLVIAFDSREKLLKLLSKQLSRFNGSNKSLNKYFNDGIIDSRGATNWYRVVISKIVNTQSLRRTTIAAVIIFSIFSYLLVPMGFVSNEFFPKTSTNLVYVSLEMPGGTNAEVTTRETLEIVEKLRAIEGVKIALAEVGRLPGGFGDLSSQPGENTAKLTLTLDADNSIEIAEQLRDTLSNYTRGTLTVTELSGGPPAGADIQLILLGNDLGKLSSLADDVVDYLSKKNGVINIKKSIAPSISKLSFVPDSVKLAQLGIGADQLGFWTRSYVSGFTLDSVQMGNDNEIDIVYRVNDTISPIDEVSSITVFTPMGPTALGSLGSFKLSPNPTLITRENGRRTISVTAGVVPGVNLSQVNSGLEEYSDSLSLPAGYEWRTGGVNEENQESVSSILQAMILSAILILATMVIQLGSYRKAIIVLLVIPLAVSGVFIAFAITRTPLSFPALIGILALFGIVVNNSIMVVEKINQNIAAGIEFGVAISDAAASRVEPIMFSSLTTILGLIPITLSDPLWRGLGGAIIAGLTVSGAIMLFFIPVVYYSWFSTNLADGKSN